jgi:hypothetical protein
VRASILCPGPSLAETAHDLPVFPGRGLVLAVNRASTFMPYDWLVAGDRHGYSWILPDGRWAYSVPRLGLLTFADTARALLAKADPQESRFWGLPVRQWEDLPDPDCAKQFSFQAALLLAQQLGADDLHVYGADMKGTRDFDGVDGFDGVTEQRYNRTDGEKDSRWVRERIAITTTILYLQRHGCTVTHHQPTRSIP